MTHTVGLACRAGSLCTTTEARCTYIHTYIRVAVPLRVTQKLSSVAPGVPFFIFGGYKSYSHWWMFLINYAQVIDMYKYLFSPQYVLPQLVHRSIRVRFLRRWWGIYASRPLFSSVLSSTPLKFKQAACKSWSLTLLQPTSRFSLQQPRFLHSMNQAWMKHEVYHNYYVKVGTNIQFYGDIYRTELEEGVLHCPYRCWSHNQKAKAPGRPKTTLQTSSFRPSHGEKEIYRAGFDCFDIVSLRYLTVHRLDRRIDSLWHYCPLFT